MSSKHDGLNYHKTSFLISAEKLAQCPENIKREVAFAGRSNAGKSSALNALVGSNSLARTSKTPGRTQLINFFEVETGLCLVDLPGYGYAKVSRTVKEEWGRHLNDYLQRRNTLVGLVLLVDIRHQMKSFDIAMLEWSAESQLPVHILLTKADKLKFGAAKNALIKIQQQAKVYGHHVSVQSFSSLKKQGVSELAKQLDQWFSGAES